MQPAGNLCWEVRFRNSSDTSPAPLDAFSGSTVTSITPFGGGCVATRQRWPAAIGSRALSVTTGSYRNRLDYGAPLAPAVFSMGVAPAAISLPGMCAPLEFLPIASVPGTTDAAGQWDLTLTFSGLNTVFDFDLYGQFVFVDPRLPAKLGVSNASQFRFPLAGAAQITRIYVSPLRGGAGHELATDGSIVRGYGSVTIFGT